METVNTMRKIKFNKYIEANKCYESGYPNEGWFHEWLHFGMVVYAIVELKEGTVVHVDSSQIKFCY